MAPGSVVAPSMPADVGAAAAEAGLSPMDYLLRVLRDPKVDAVRRDRAAALLLPFAHPKASELGKKLTAAERAKIVATGKYAPSEPPKLSIIGKKAAAQAAAVTAQDGTDWEALLNPK